MYDLPTNDWNVLRNTVEPAFPDIKFIYKPVSVYEPTYEEGTVHLAYSCYAQHWLSHGAPTGLLGGAFWANQLPHGDEYRLKWEEASRRDWETLLTLRAKELVPGGIMIFHIQSCQCNGFQSERHPAIFKQAKVDMIADGELSEEEGRLLVMPEYFKTPADILSPLVKGPIMYLWDVLEVEHRKMPCVYIEELHTYRRDSQEVDQVIIRKIFEKQIVMFRSFMDSTIVACIGKDRTDSFWNRVEVLAGYSPERLSTDLMATFICLRRSKVTTE